MPGRSEVWSPQSSYAIQLYYDVPPSPGLLSSQELAGTHEETKLFLPVQTAKVLTANACELRLPVTNVRIRDD